MVKLISLTSLARLIYLSSLAVVIGVGSFYADYLRKNNIGRNNEIATISLIIFAVILFVISLRSISKYILSYRWNLFLVALFFSGLAASFALTVYYYFQDKSRIDNEHVNYFYTILVFSALSIVLLLILFFVDNSFITTGMTFTGADSKKVALNQAKERMENIVKNSNVSTEDERINTYKKLIKYIDNNIDDRKKLNNLILKTSYLYGKDQFVMNVLLSECVVTGAQKTKFNYKEAFDKMTELKNSDTATIKLKNYREDKEDTYNYSDLKDTYINHIDKTSSDMLMRPSMIFKEKHCKDLLGHLPVVHDPGQDIINKFKC